MTSRVVSELVADVSVGFGSLHPANAPSIRPALIMHVTNLKVFIVLSPFLFFAHSYITPPINTIGINKITKKI